MQRHESGAPSGRGGRRGYRLPGTLKPAVKALDASLCIANAVVMHCLSARETNYLLAVQMYALKTPSAEGAGSSYRVAPRSARRPGPVVSMHTHTDAAPKQAFSVAGGSEDSENSVSPVRAQGLWWGPGAILASWLSLA
jgi:hypothetical protein